MPEGIWGTVFIALWALLLVQTGMLVVLSRQLRRLTEQHGPDAASVGLALGAEAPEIEVETIAGERVRLGGAAPWKRLLIFLSPGCPGCRAAIREVQQVRRDGAEMLLLWSADETKTRDLADEYQIRLPMVADADASLWKQFMISGVPFAMVIDEEGRVAAKAFAHNQEQLEALLARREPRTLLQVEQPPPEREPAGAEGGGPR